MCNCAYEDLVLKILNLEEFRKLPAGTIFLKYEPCVFEELQCKGDTWDHDFLSENIAYNIENTGSDDFSGKLFDAQEYGISLKMDFNCRSRDGCFDRDQLFAVYEKQDVEMLISKLTKCLGSAYT